MPTFVGTQEPVLFTFVLFNPSGKSKWFEYYRDSTVAFVKRMAEYWPAAIFWGHVGEHVDNTSLEMMFDAAGPNVQNPHQPRIRFTRYTISERPDKHWLVAAMRLPALWEHDGPETVISIDIHDDIKVQNRQIDKLMKTLQIQQTKRKELAMTYWAARDKVCHNGSSLPHGRHNHFDAGLCVWRPGKAREVACNVGDFMRYCCQILHNTGPLPRAIDEALADAFLAGSGIHDFAVFERHVHKIRAIKPSTNEMMTGKESPTRKKRKKKTNETKDQEEREDQEEQSGKETKRMKLELPKKWKAIVHERTGTYKKYTSFVGPNGEKCRSIPEVYRRIGKTMPGGGGGGGGRSSNSSSSCSSSAKGNGNNQQKRKRITMELPPGFSKKVTIRKMGATAGQKDISYLENSTKTRFRSMTAVLQYVEKLVGSGTKNKKKTPKKNRPKKESSSEDDDDDDDDDDDEEEETVAERLARKQKAYIQVFSKKNGPKRAATAYTLYMVEVRPATVAKHPELTNQQQMRSIGSMWRALTKEQQQPWQEKALALKVECKRLRTVFEEGPLAVFMKGPLVKMMKRAKKVYSSDESSSSEEDSEEEEASSDDDESEESDESEDEEPPVKKQKTFINLRGKQKTWLMNVRVQTALAAKAKLTNSKSSLAKQKAAALKALKIKQMKEEEDAMAAIQAEQEALALKLASRKPSQIAAEKRLEIRQHLALYVSKGKGRCFFEVPLDMCF
jgi:hypothetical protein